MTLDYLVESIIVAMSDVSSKSKYDLISIWLARWIAAGCSPVIETQNQINYD